MNKSELIAAISENAEISKTSAEKVLNTITETITSELKAGKSVVLVGFGTFEVRQTAARTGRNPQTGKALEIAASIKPAFKAGKTLKEKCNEK
jgi:DNA-binding protein HU-beta